VDVIGKYSTNFKLNYFRRVLIKSGDTDKATRSYRRTYDNPARRIGLEQARYFNYLSSMLLLLTIDIINKFDF